METLKKTTLISVTAKIATPPACAFMKWVETLPTVEWSCGYKPPEKWKCCCLNPLKLPPKSAKTKWLAVIGSKQELEPG